MNSAIRSEHLVGTLSRLNYIVSLSKDFVFGHPTTDTDLTIHAPNYLTTPITENGSGPINHFGGVAIVRFSKVNQTWPITVTSKCGPISVHSSSLRIWWYPWMWRLFLLAGELISFCRSRSQFTGPDGKTCGRKSHKKKNKTKKNYQLGLGYADVEKLSASARVSDTRGGTRNETMAPTATRQKATFQMESCLIPGWKCCKHATKVREGTPRGVRVLRQYGG